MKHLKLAFIGVVFDVQPQLSVRMLDAQVLQEIAALKTSATELIKLLYEGKSCSSVHTLYLGIAVWGVLIGVILGLY